jgi:hypothetical protein
VAQDIDRKLRVTAAFLGAVTAKDLAAAFRRANPVTSFDVERAHKWIQGRARPRESRLYEDWAKVVDLDRPGAWIADCISTTSGQRQERNPSLAGTYACYSHAWSPYFRGQIIRGEFSIAQQQGSQRLLARYSERLPTSRLHLEGPAKVRFGSECGPPRPEARDAESPSDLYLTQCLVALTGESRS